MTNYRVIDDCGGIDEIVGNLEDAVFLATDLVDEGLRDSSFQADYPTSVSIWVRIGVGKCDITERKDVKFDKEGFDKEGIIWDDDYTFMWSNPRAELTDIGEQLKTKDEEIRILKGALEQIANPLKFLTSIAGKGNTLVNGSMTDALSKDVNLLENWAKNALTMCKK